MDSCNIQSSLSNVCKTSRSLRRRIVTDVSQFCIKYSAVLCFKNALFHFQATLKDVLVCDVVLMALTSVLPSTRCCFLFLFVTCPRSFRTICHVNLFVNNNNAGTWQLSVLWLTRIYTCQLRPPEVLQILLPPGRKLSTQTFLAVTPSNHWHLRR